MGYYPITVGKERVNINRSEFSDILFNNTLLSEIYFVKVTFNSDMSTHKGAKLPQQSIEEQT